MDNELISKYNAMIDRITKGTEVATLALDLEDMQDKVDELVQLIEALEEENVELRATCISLGYNPEQQQTRVAEVE